jgi:hypothetical protein
MSCFAWTTSVPRGDRRSRSVEREAKQSLALVTVGSEVDELALRAREDELTASASPAGRILVHEDVDIGGLRATR